MFRKEEYRVEHKGKLNKYLHACIHAHKNYVIGLHVSVIL